MRRLTLALFAALLVASSCSVETKDFDALFGDDFNIDALETAQSSRVYDRNGTLITELRGEQNRTDVGIEEIPELVQNAVVAIEDERFWDHAGVDLKAILRAARSNVSAGGIAQGGSTITQQYVGNVFLDRSEQTGSRKVEEIFMARRFEQRYTKEFILEKYLNWVYFGNGAYGVEAAARTYFGPPSCERQTSAFDTDDRECLKVTELTIVEAATIAGLISSSRRFNPYINYEAARDRRDLVLLRMYANDYITEEEYETALLQPIDLVEDVPILEEEYPAAHFVEDVKQWFLDNPRSARPRGAHRPAVRGWARHLHHHRSGSAGRGRGCGRAGLAPNRRRRIVQPRRCCGRHGRHSGRRRPHPCHGRRPDFFGADDDAKFNLLGIGPTSRLVDEADRSGRRSPTRHPDHPLLRRHSRSKSPTPVCGPTWKVRGGAEATAPADAPSGRRTRCMPN